MEGTERALIHIKVFATPHRMVLSHDTEVRVGLESNYAIEIGEKLAVSDNGLIKLAEPGDTVIGVAMETISPAWCIWIREEYVTI